MPLSIIIIGGGIAGLTAALGLKKGGHNVTVFEKSAFAAEVGAAVSLAPNGSRVLARLGFDFKRARAVPLHVWDVRDGQTLEVIQSVTPAAESYGYPLQSVHRVDFHNELLRLANAEGGERVPRVSSAVVSVDPAVPSVTLANGEAFSADLIIAADGVHSTARKSLITDSRDTPKRALTSFRFLVPTEELIKIPGAQRTYQLKAEYATGFVDRSAPEGQDRHFVWYPCRDGQIQNFNCLTTTYDGPIPEDAEASKQELLRQFSSVHASLKAIMEAADGVKMWPLIQRPTLSNWNFGRVILIGDAAHPMLPIGGQGGNQAIEDGGALGLLFAGIDPAQLDERIDLFQKARTKRAARCQILSSVRSGREADVTTQLEDWIDDTIMEVPTTMAGRIHHDFSFDLDAMCTKLLGGRSAQAAA